MYFKGAVCSNIGNQRENNEDNFSLLGKSMSISSQKEICKTKKSFKNYGLAAVCDGVGGAYAGEVASATVVKHVLPIKETKIRDEILRQLERANYEICDYREENNCIQMGTTIAAVYFVEEIAFFMNVGDSRGYHYSGGKLKQCTKDHSLAQDYIDQGKMDEATARKHRSWHVITQHIGVLPEEGEIKPYFSAPIFVRNKDYFLLCSDGLTDVVSDIEIEVILKKKKTIMEKCKRLVHLALEKGGRDNVTVLIIECRKGIFSRK